MKSTLLHVTRGAIWGAKTCGARAWGATGGQNFHCGIAAHHPNDNNSRGSGGCESGGPGGNVEVEQRGRVRVIKISRPEARNCVNRATAAELYEAFQDLNSSDGADVGVLCGEGGAFCAGYDLKELASFSAVPPDALQYTKGGPSPMGPCRMAILKPTIAAVCGYAVAGGLELSLMCDMRVADEDAVFGVFCRRFGVPLIDGGTVRLPALIGASRAMDMILTGRAVGAKEALQMGLVNRVVPKGECLERAVELAQEIAGFPQQCLRADRRSAMNAAFGSLSMEEALAYEHSNGAKVLASESRPGAQRFVAGEGRGGAF